MNEPRRALLAAAGFATAIGLAGCAERPGDSLPPSAISSAQGSPDAAAKAESNSNSLLKASDLVPSSSDLSCQPSDSKTTPAKDFPVDMQDRGVVQAIGTEYPPAAALLKSQTSTAAAIEASRKSISSCPVATWNVYEFKLPEQATKYADFLFDIMSKSPSHGEVLNDPLWDRASITTGAKLNALLARKGQFVIVALPSSPDQIGTVQSLADTLLSRALKIPNPNSKPSLSSSTSEVGHPWNSTRFGYSIQYPQGLTPKDSPDWDVFINNQVVPKTDGRVTGGIRIKSEIPKNNTTTATLMREKIAIDIRPFAKNISLEPTDMRINGLPATALDYRYPGDTRWNYVPSDDVGSFSWIAFNTGEPIRVTDILIRIGNRIVFIQGVTSAKDPSVHFSTLTSLTDSFKPF